MKRWIKSFLALAMILSLVSTFATPVFATTLNFYINDGSETVHFTSEADATGTGWSYQASTNELTLSGFTGTSILADGKFTLVLDGTNTINVTSASEGYLVGSSASGIFDLTIRAKTSSSLDSLNFVGHDLTALPNTVYCIRDTLIVESGSLNFDYYAASDVLIGNFIYATYYPVKLKNDSNFTFQASGFTRSPAFDDVLESTTSGTINCKIYDKYPDDSVAIHGYYLAYYGFILNGTGTTTFSYPGGNLFSNGGSRFVIGSNAGPISLTGTIALSGDTSMYSFRNLNIDPSHTMTSTAPWVLTRLTETTTINGTDYSAGHWVFADASGNPLESFTITNTPNTTLTFVDSDYFDITNATAGTNYNVRQYFNLATFGGVRPYTYYVDSEYPLPDGLEIIDPTSNSDTNSACIYGTPTTGGTGVARIHVKDSSDTPQDVYIDINYNVAGLPTKYITVDGTGYDNTENQTGEGWSYDASTKTITLSGYHGSQILNEDSTWTIVLDGANTIDISDVDNGIIIGHPNENGGTLTIKAKNSTATDSLSFVGHDLTGFTPSYFYIIRPDTYVESGQIILDMYAAPDTLITTDTYFCYYNLYLNNNASLTAKISGFKRAPVADYSLYCNTSGNVDIRYYDKYPSDTVDETSKYVFYNGISLKGTGSVYVDNEKGAITYDCNRFYVGENAGNAEFKGVMVFGTYSDFSKIDKIYCAPNHVIKSSTGKDYNYTFVDSLSIGSHNFGTGNYVITDDDKNIIKDLVVTSGTNTLRLKQNDLFNLTGLKIGESTTSNYLSMITLGGTPPYTYTVSEYYPLPAGLSIVDSVSSTSANYAKIKGTPTVTGSGTARIIVTDANGKSAYLDLDYNVADAFAATGINVVEDEIYVDAHGNLSSANVHVEPIPSNATEFTYEVSYSGIRVVKVDDRSYIVDGYEPGVYSFVAKLDGARKDSVTVYVRNEKPLPRLSNSGTIYNLKSNGTYLITVDGVTNEYTANSSGEISVPTAWHAQELTIVHKNTNEKINSVAVKMYIPISGEPTSLYDYEDYFEIARATFDGTPATPKVTNSYLVEGRDFEVYYYDNTTCRMDASVRIVGIGSYGNTVYKTFPIYPDVPTVKVTSVNATTNKITYNPCGETYDILRCTTKDGAYSYLATGIAETEYLDTTATLGKTYYYMVTSCLHDPDTSINYEEDSEPVKIVTSIGAPTNLTTSYSSSAITLSWDAVVGATSYTVYRATSATGTYSAIATVKTTSYKNTGLSPKTTYYYKVKANKTVGTKKYTSAYSAVVSDKPAVKKVANLTSTAVNETTSKVKWDAVSYASGYEIYVYNTTLSAYDKVATTTSTSYTVTGLTLGKDNKIKVVAYRDSDKRRYGSEAVAELKLKLTAPAHIYCDYEDENRQYIEWDSVPYATSYKVYRATSKTGTYKEVAETPNNEVILTATYGKTYYYKVKAVYNTGEKVITSAYSGIQACKFILDTPNVYYHEAISYETIQIKFNPSYGSDYYIVQYATSSTGKYTTYDKPTTNATINFPATYGKTYYFKITAVHEMADGTLQKSAAGTFTQKVALNTPAYYDAFVWYNNEVDKEVNCIETKTQSMANYYEIYRATSEKGTYSLLGRMSYDPGNEYVYYDDESAVYGKTYYYKVKAVIEDDGVQKYTKTSAVKKLTATVQKPSQKLTATTGSIEVRVYGNAPLSSVGFEVYRATSSTGKYTLVGTQSTTYSWGWTDTSVTKGKTYYYKTRLYVVIGGVKYYGSYSTPTYTKAK